ncbi:hypothetical protein MMC24_002762 [Lignoscripta atroalba]|nr:hypothetical protein [Lignoscripta atroalba]
MYLARNKEPLADLDGLRHRPAKNLQTIAITLGIVPAATIATNHPRLSLRFSASTTTSFLSPTIDTTVPSMPPTTTNYSPTAAPLPSPSTTQQSQFFASPQDDRRQTPSYAQHHIASSMSQTQQGGGGYGYDARKGGVNDPTASTPFLRDFNLVAEAAKRAQVAVLMRDMGDVSL